MKEAAFWKPAGEERVRCSLCSQRCLIASGRRGLCGVRENRDGRLYSLVYGRAVSHAVDPIEKKPLYHFLPGTESFSIATVGCNFRCLHCQNYGISQSPSERAFSIGAELSPQRIVAIARQEGCRSISYTYTEPTIFFEYAYDTAVRAAGQGLRNAFVTNGYITPEPLKKIQPYLDAANIDLKFFRDELYRDICGARLDPVLDSIRLYHELGIWIELTTLVIPDHNDDEAQLTAMAEFIAGIDPAIPWHVTGFYPTFKLTSTPPTDAATLRRAREIGKAAGLKYVYTGNVIDADGSRTSCPGCGETLIDRHRFTMSSNRVQQGSCPHCGSVIEGVWE